MNTRELNATIIAQLEADLNQTIPLLPLAFNRVIAKVLAGTTVLLFQYGDWISLQHFVRFASAKLVTVGSRTYVPLFEWGEMVGIGLPVPATQAELELTVNGHTGGGSLPAGTPFQGVTNGVTYISLSTTVINAPTVTVRVRAQADQAGGDGSGVVGNLVIGDPVSFVNPPAFVTRDTVVESVLVTAAEQEDTELYRQRIIDFFQKRPEGGALLDYRIWAVEVAGIVSAYPYTGIPAGTVRVFAEATVASSGSADGIPTQAQLEAVKDSIELDEEGLASRRPVGVLTAVQAIARQAFTVTVTALSVSADQLADVQADITAEITKYFLDREPFIPGVSALPRKDAITKSALVGRVQDIVEAAGGSFGTVNFDSGGGNLIKFTLGVGQKAKATVGFIA